MKTKVNRNKKLKVLCLEDSPRDADIVHELLISNGYDLSMDISATEKDFISFLRGITYDVILSDFKLPGFDGFTALRWAMEICPKVPFICVSGTIGEENAVEILKQGAVDYVIKDRLERLPFAVKRALDGAKEKDARWQAEEALQKSEKRFRELYNNAKIGLYRTSPDGTILLANKCLVNMLGYPSFEKLAERNFKKDGFAQSSQHKEFLEKIEKYGQVNDFESAWTRWDGSVFFVRESTQASRDCQSKTLYYDGIVEDITEHRLTESAIREKEYLLTQSQYLAHIGSWGWNLKGSIKWTDETYRIYGVSRETFTPTIESLVSLVHPEDRQSMQQWLEACGAGKSPDDLDFRTTLSDGSVRFICVSGDMIFDAENKPFFMAGTMCDITDRKRTEEALRESETRYRSVLQSATDAIVTVDSSGIIIGWNNAAERIFGYRYTEAVGQPLTSIVSLYHHDENSNGMKGLQTEGGQNALGRTVEFKGFRKDKSVFPIELSLSSWETKSGRFFTGIIRDITERKQMEESLLTSEIRYRTFFENSMDAILLENSDGKIFSANQASCAMFGYLEEELINLGRSGIMDIADPRLLAFVSERALKGKARGELTLIRKDGTRFPSEISSAIFENREGQANTSIVIHDITERKKMEEGLRQMQKLEGLGTLAGGIAHDFNNILGIILAYNSNIKKFKDDSKKLDLATETITKAVDRGRTLVQQILMFARKTETSFSAVNVNDVVMEVVIMIYEMFPKNVTCSQNFDKSIHYINADRSQLHQVLMNLCVNARDAMPKGGVLSISTHMESVTSLRNQHPGASESSYICIEVSDTGEGMTSETQKRIFEPFFTTKGIGKGTGLGLSVTFGVIQTHKGFIDVESELGKGTTFRVYLPASRVAEPIRETQEKALEEMPGGTETLLIVEDEEMLLMSLQMVLVDKGYKVLSVQDGFKALKIYQENKNKIALVITDLGLPNISGLEVCQQIKKINPKERIILATGYLDPEMKTEFLKAGIQHFLYKPYDLTKVLKEVRDVLDEK